MNQNNFFFDRLKQKLGTFEPRQFQLDRPQAAVLVPILLDPEPAILLTVRAAHLNSHPGQVSFPGGMSEAHDKTMADTALRETEEEIAMDRGEFSIVGELSTAFSKDGVQVYPIVGVAQSHQTAVASPDEIAEIFTVPWQFFLDNEPELKPIARHGMSFKVPHYHYRGHHIWGLTAMILLELFNVVEETNWPVPDFTTASKPGVSQ